MARPNVTVLEHPFSAAIQKGGTVEIANIGLVVGARDRQTAFKLDGEDWLVPLSTDQIPTNSYSRAEGLMLLTLYGHKNAGGRLVPIYNKPGYEKRDSELRKLIHEQTEILANRAKAETPRAIELYPAAGAHAERSLGKGVVTVESKARVQAKRDETDAKRRELADDNAVQVAALRKQVEDLMAIVKSQQTSGGSGGKTRSA